MNDMQRQALQWGETALRVAAQHKVTSRITELIRTSQVLTLVMQLRQPGDLGTMLRLDEPMALALGVDSVRIQRARGFVNVEISLPRELFVALPLSALAPQRHMAVALGKSVVNQPVSLEIGNEMTPHALVAGTTGSGKSVLLRTLVLQLARQNRPEKLRMLLIDGKARGLTPFAALPHLIHRVVTEPDEAVKALAWAVAELDRRKAQPANWQMVLVIDEIAEIIALTGGKDGLAAQMLIRLCQLGRELGIFVVLATQYPTGDVLGGSLAKANLPARLTGRVGDASASTLATGQAGMHAHKLRGRGDFLLVAGEVQRLQVAQPSPEDLGSLPAVESVPELPLDDATADGAMSATAAAANGNGNSVPDPLTPAQVAWVVANSIDGVPGIGRIKTSLSVGSRKAERLQVFCRELLEELQAAGCDVLCPCDDCEPVDQGEPEQEEERG